MENDGLAAVGDNQDWTVTIDGHEEKSWLILARGWRLFAERRRDWGTNLFDETLAEQWNPWKAEDSAANNDAREDKGVKL